MRLALGVLFVLHGLLHLLGVAKAFGFAELPALTQPISRPMGVAWGLAAALWIAAAVVEIGWPRSWGWLGLAAAVVSQGVIMTAWTDARFGTLPNVVGLLAVIYTLLSFGPGSLFAAYTRDVAAVRAGEAAIVAAAEVDRLPAPVARYLRRAGVVGRPYVHDVYASMTGRIRGGPTEAWMPFVAEQHNVGVPAARLFWMEATKGGVPVKVYHRFVGGVASMRVKLASLITMVDASGPALTKAETVTLFNDMCLLAPGLLLDPRVVWGAATDRTVEASFTLGPNTVRATLIFNDADELVDFVSDDRAILNPDGSTTAARWRTPIDRYADYDGHHLMAHGEARWVRETSDFAYIEMTLTDVKMNVLPLRA